VQVVDQLLQVARPMNEHGSLATWPSLVRRGGADLACPLGFGTPARGHKIKRGGIFKGSRPYMVL
jgi:hypothetical protein